MISIEGHISQAAAIACHLLCHDIKQRHRTLAAAAGVVEARAVTWHRADAGALEVGTQCCQAHFLLPAVAHAGLQAQATALASHLCEGVILEGRGAGGIVRPRWLPRLSLWSPKILFLYLYSIYI